MANIKAGVVLVTRYTTPHSSVYESYIDYMARDCATRQRNASKFMLSSLSDDLGYVGYAFDYMDDARKSSNLFTATKDSLSKDEILELQTAFRTAQKNGSPMWQSIISFDNTFLEQYGIYSREMQLLDEERIRSLTRVCMKRMLQKEELLQTAVYTASIHYNTDNIHVHIATVEPIPTRPEATIKKITIPRQFIADHGILDDERDYRVDRSTKVTTYKGGYNRIFAKLTSALGQEDISLRLGNYITINSDRSISMTYRGNRNQVPLAFSYSEETAIRGKFSKKSIDAGKSGIVNEIINQRGLQTEINNILRENIVQRMRKSEIESDPELTSAFVSLLKNLPRDHRLWKYGNQAMTEYRPMIDKITSTWINKYYPDEYQNLERHLKEMDAVYQTAYGASGSSYAKGKRQDLYARCGNRVLLIARQTVHALDRRTSQHAGSPSLPKHIYNTPNTSYAYQHEIEISIRLLKKALSNDYEHFKNQVVYDRLMKEADYEAYQDL